MNKFAFGFAAAVAVVAAPVSAAVALVSAPVTLSATDAGLASGTFTRNFNGIIDPNVIAGLTGSIDFALTSVSGSGKVWTFSALVKNTSSGQVTSSAISGFGLTTNPDIVTGTPLVGPFDKFDGGGNFPQVQANVGFCFTAGSNCAGGGGNSGSPVLLGGQALQTFSLTFAQSPVSVIFDQFVVRYQQLDYGNVRGSSAIGLGTGPGGGGGGGGGGGTGGPVPEPASWAMMIAGFGLVGASMRRRASRGLTVTA